MRVCVLGVFDPDYARHYSLCEGLKRVGVEVTLRRLPSRSRTVGRIVHMIRQFPKREPFDVVLVPAFNQMLAPSVWLMGCLFGKPVLLDYLVGLTDANQDRGMRNGWKAILFRWIDRFNVDRMTSITDTLTHQQFYRDLLGTSAAKMRVVPVGARDDAVCDSPPERNDGVLVQFVGTYIPFHGVDVIIRAARLLCEFPSIRFQLIGKGQTYASCRQLASELDVTNVEFVTDHFSYAELLPLLGKADVSLGVFGASEKTNYVVPTKVYDSLSVGRPLITADSTALGEFFTPSRGVRPV